MRSDRDYPLSALREALESIVGWTLTIAVMILLGIYLGYWIGSGKAPSVETVATILGVSLITWFVLPGILLADVASLLIWGVPLMLNIESLSIRIGGAIVVLLVWMAVGGAAGALLR